MDVTSSLTGTMLASTGGGGGSGTASFDGIADGLGGGRLGGPGRGEAIFGELIWLFELSSSLSVPNPAGLALPHGTGSLPILVLVSGGGVKIGIAGLDFWPIGSESDPAIVAPRTRPGSEAWMAPLFLFGRGEESPLDPLSLIGSPLLNRTGAESWRSKVARGGERRGPSLGVR